MKDLEKFIFFKGGFARRSHTVLYASQLIMTGTEENYKISVLLNSTESLRAGCSSLSANRNYL